MKRGHYRVPRKAPANRIEGPLSDVVRAKFAEGWPKARIARELRLNRRTAIRIGAPPAPHPKIAKSARPLQHRPRVERPSPAHNQT